VQPLQEVRTDAHGASVFTLAAKPLGHAFQAGRLWRWVSEWLFRLLGIASFEDPDDGEVVLELRLVRRLALAVLDARLRSRGATTDAHDRVHYLSQALDLLLLVLDVEVVLHLYFVHCDVQPSLD